MSVHQLTNNVTSLSNESIDIEPRPFSWKDERCSQWNIVLPDVSNLSVIDCKRILEDHGEAFPDPNPWMNDPQELYDYAEMLGVEGEYRLYSYDLLRNILVEAIDSEKIYGIQKWRKAVANFDKNNAHIFGPVMDGYCDIPDLKDEQNIAELQHKLRNYALVVVEVYGKPKLAIREKSEHINWDICEAYMMLGFKPPVCFVDLSFCVDVYDFETVSACILSVEEKIKRYYLKIESLIALQDAMGDMDKNISVT